MRGWMKYVKIKQAQKGRAQGEPIKSYINMKLFKEKRMTEFNHLKQEKSEILPKQLNVVSTKTTCDGVS